MIKLLTLWSILDDRNQQLGYERYDFGDVRSHPLVMRLTNNGRKRVVLKALQGIELAAPMMWRRVLGVRKHIIPSLFYHLGMSYMTRSRLPDPPLCKEYLETVSQKALDICLDSEYICWSHPFSHHGSKWRREPRIDVPHSCAHHTGRVGLMLMKAGLFLDRVDLIRAGVSAAEALLRYHNWQSYSDGTRTISYYPDTCDEVINTGADAAVLLASVPSEHRTSEMQESMEGLVRMVLYEQQQDGSWYYCTSRHHEAFGESRVIDNHHSAMNLSALATIDLLNVLPNDLTKLSRKSLERGMHYYLNKLYQPDGRGINRIGSRQSTGVVGYSEGVSAISAYLEAIGGQASETSRQAWEMAPKMLDVAIKQFVNRRTGDVACNRFLGRPYHIQSARWGSAPLMQAITDYLWLKQQNESLI